jgi:hypothetical protein
MHPVLKPPDVLTDTLATHAGVHLYIEKVTNGQHTLSVCEASSLVGERINALMPIWSKLLTTSTPGEVSKVRLSSSMLRAPRREVVAAAIGGGDESRRERGGGGTSIFFFLPGWHFLQFLFQRGRGEGRRFENERGLVCDWADYIRWWGGLGWARLGFPFTMGLEGPR